MNIDKPLCRHSELKQICKWYIDGNCILNIVGNVAPCEKIAIVRCSGCKHFVQQYDTHTGRKLHFGICRLNSNAFHDEEVNCDHYCGYGEPI